MAPRGNPDDLPSEERIALLAPCGMDCAYCSSYLNYAFEKPRPHCAGCLPRGKTCAFVKGRCPRLRDGTVRFCHECETFPCSQLEKLDRRYLRRGWDVSFTGNNRRLAEVGAELFLAEQKLRHGCPRCGGPVAVHTGVCYQCGAPREP